MIRSEEVRFKVLRNNADYAWIYPKEKTKPSLRNRAGGEIKLSLQGAFIPIAFDSRGREVPFDFLTDEIQPVLTINGVKSNLGVLSFAKVEDDDSEKGHYVSVEAYDRCWRLRETKTEDILHLNSGVYYLTYVEQLLTACGVTNIVKTPSTETLSEDREDWDVGTSYLKIINDLLKEINYKNVWFDASGSAVLQPKSKVTGDSIQHVLSNRKLNIRDRRAIEVISIKRDLKKSTDIYNAPNVFICSCSNPDKDGIWIAKAENTNPQSPISIPRRGRRIVDHEKVNNIASLAELQNYAEQKRDKSMITNEIITCTTLLQPGFGTEDVIGLQLGEAGTPDMLDCVCLETSWDMQLGVGGLMTHELERTVYNID